MRISLLCLVLFSSIVTFAQSVLTPYTIIAKRSETCDAFLKLELFDEKYGKDSLNQYIINELIKYHYGVNNPGLFVSRFYRNTKYREDAPIHVNIAGMCSFQNKGIYSFVSCPINACTNETYSNYESIALTIDSAKGKAIHIKDIIKPELLDSFEQFVLMVARRYNIRNLPTGYISSLDPILVRSSNSVGNPANTLTYVLGLQPQFYISNNFLIVYNEATNSDYPYKAVEVSLPLSLTKYFLRPDYARVFIPE